MRPFFTIAIPTWEINGKGVEYLDYSLNIIAHQSFKDFDVVVSDHSENDDINNLCKSWNQTIDVKYYKNEEGRGKIAPNANNAIKNCTGQYIKMLFQDDFLYGTESLMIVYNAIQKNKEANWIVTGCAHTDDGETMHSPMIPQYNDFIHIGYNTISCPTVLTIKNEYPLFFDNSLNWLVDVEYYKRLYLMHGLPLVIPDICAINRNAEVRTTNMISEQKKQEEVERVKKMYDKIG